MLRSPLRPVGKLPTIAAAALAAAAIGGCGLGAGTTPSGVQLLVTRGFGAQTVTSASQPKIVGADTVMRMLERNATVTTLYGGGFVQSIDGLSGGSASGEPTAWFYYVNGLQAGKGAAATKLHSGDHVWWDLHDWAASESIPAVVGSFPEPFLDGYGGERYPSRVECTQTQSAACSEVGKELAKFNIPAALGCLECSEYNQSLRVLVGPYATLTPDPAAASLQDGPATSGVYARFIDGGRKLELLNANGAVKQTLGPGTGLVAATRWHGQPPVWFVTGTDAAGVAAAEQAFTPGTLDGNFAVAVVNDTAEPLPLAGR
ncbi:MAG: DUF4430 domain-containing protein [Solirubrobacteraceae bacterium]|jgi:hypothetical protein